MSKEFVFFSFCSPNMGMGYSRDSNSFFMVVNVFNILWELTHSLLSVAYLFLHFYVLRCR